MTIIWCMVLRCGAQQTEFFVILDHILSFYPTNNPKNKIFEKGKDPGDIALHMCTINDNQMIYGSWDMECNAENFLSFENLSGTFTHLTNWKIKHLIKLKKKY